MDNTHKPDKTIIYDRNAPRKHFRKQPYPQRSPESAGDGLVYRIIIYEIYAKNPTLLLKSNCRSDHSNDSTKEIAELIEKIEQLPIMYQNMNYMNPLVTINWKHWDDSKKMDVSNEVGYYCLHEKEKILCSRLRLTPHKYLIAKFNILSEALKYKKQGKKFKKIDAQGCIKGIDANKKCVLWEFFYHSNWF